MKWVIPSLVIGFILGAITAELKRDFNTLYHAKSSYMEFTKEHSFGP